MAVPVLTDDAILHILDYLDTEDRIFLAYTCSKFRQICQDHARVMRKVDLSRSVIRRPHEVNQFLTAETRLFQHIRKLILNNQRVVNWQMDLNLQVFVMAICPQLEALHVVNCGLSFRRLNLILQHAHKLTTLSWSLMDLAQDDLRFLVKDAKSSNYGICMEKIRNLHLEILDSKQHLKILKHLVLYRSKCLEELEIYIWLIRNKFGLELEHNWQRIVLRQPPISASDILENLHSLSVLAVGDQPHSCLIRHSSMGIELSDFVFSVMKKKPPETKWKKFWISSPFSIADFLDMFDGTAFSAPFSRNKLEEFGSVEALTSHAHYTYDVVNMWKILLQRIEDQSVKKLQLCANAHHLPCECEVDMISKLCEPVFRIAGDALKFFSLCLSPTPHLADAEAFNRLFLACPNIAELDLLGCHFEKNICGALSKLKHLTKIQLLQCALLPKDRNKYEQQKAHSQLVTFMESCQNIEEFDLRGCDDDEFCFTVFNTDLLVLSKLRKLKSLTLHEIHDIRRWAFLKKIAEHCKFLTMLRIVVMGCTIPAYAPILDSVRFLKHLAIEVPSLDLGSGFFWKLVSNATALERLCITCEYSGYLYIRGVEQILRSLPRLYVLHIHCYRARNLKGFRDHILRMLEEEKSNRISCFEFLLQYQSPIPSSHCIFNKVLPLNLTELCYKTPILSLPKLESS